jgi:hypothetical protein
MGDLNKLLGAAYHALSEEEKAVYTSKAAEDKVRMERELAEGGVLPARKTKAAGAGAVEKPAAKRLNNSPYDVSTLLPYYNTLEMLSFLNFSLCVFHLFCFSSHCSSSARNVGRS